MKLNLIVHGRCASTRITSMLARTHEFSFWGENSKQTESSEVRSMVWTAMRNDDWNENSIKEIIKKKNFKGDILTKLPEFGFCIDKFFFLNPSILVLQRSPFEKLRSLIKIGWEQAAWDGYKNNRLFGKAKKEYYKRGGRYLNLNKRCEVFLMQVWGNWYTEYHLRQYQGEKLFIQFDDIVMRSRDVYCLLDEFYGFEPMKYWDMWDEVGETKFQSNHRAPNPENFSKPYQIDLDKDREVFAEMVCLFDTNK